MCNSHAYNLYSAKIRINSLYKRSGCIKLMRFDTPACMSVPSQESVGGHEVVLLHVVFELTELGVVGSGEE